MSDLHLDDVTFSPASRDECVRGLLGFVTATIAGTLVVDGIAVRRSRRGRPYLAFPARVTGAGQHWSILRPRDQAARDRVEREILTAIGLLPTKLDATEVRDDS